MRQSHILLSALCLLLAVLVACEPKQRIIIEETLLGTFAMDKSGNSVERDFRIPDTATQSLLGFAIVDLPYTDTNYTQIISAVKNLAVGPPRVRLELLEKTNRNGFYKAEFALGDGATTLNLKQTGFTNRPEWSFYISGITPLPYGDSEFAGEATVQFTFSGQTQPLERGKLRPGADYKARLTVLSPSLLTNNCALRVYSWCAGPRD